MNDSSSDRPSSVSPWFTYADAAARFGISPEAVRQLAMRYRWPRRKRNDDRAGRVQVLIPEDFEVRPRMAVQRPSNGRAPDEGSVLLEAWRRERERADQAEKQRDAAVSRADTADFDRRAAEARVDAAVARADSAEQALAAERDRSSALQSRIEGLRELWKASEAAVADARRQASEAAQTAEALQRFDDLRQAYDARKARSGWARLWAIWWRE
jgi:hypothetical protein